MGRIIKRRWGEEYFLIVAGDLKLGDYIKIRKEEIGKARGYFSRDDIKAPPSIAILTDDLVKEKGGLESVIEQIKCGTFEFKTSRFIGKNR